LLKLAWRWLLLELLLSWLTWWPLLHLRLSWLTSWRTTWWLLLLLHELHLSLLHLLHLSWVELVLLDLARKMMGTEQNVNIVSIEHSLKLGREIISVHGG